MKKSALALFLIILGAFPAFALAGTIRFNENYSLRKGEAVQGDLYAIGSNTTIAGTVLGDLVATGLSVFIGGNEIGEDVLVFANTAHIISGVKKDLRVLARNVYIGGFVGEDVVVVAQSFEIVPEALIQGDVSAAAGKIKVLGAINGSLTGVAGEVFIDDVVKGNVSLRADRIILGPHAVLSGSFLYAASAPVEISEGALVVGETTYTQIDTRSQAEKFIPTLWGTWVFIKFVILLLSALIFHGILRNISKRFVDVSVNVPWASLLKGFLAMVGVPIAAFIGFLTFIGIPFSLLALALYAIAVLSAFVYAPIVLGTLLFRLFDKEHGVLVNWKTICLGVAVFTILDFIPYIGAPTAYVLMLIALGGIYQVLFDKFVEAR